MEHPPSSKLRLMCSYGGHILPRPHDKSLFYACGETRIVAVDRRTTAASLSALTAHLSRFLFHNRRFHLKYQLPNEDLDSLISVITDEDLFNMIDEHDRITALARIRLFLFPVKVECVDPKSDSWFSDALKGTGVSQSADSRLLMEIGSGLDTPVETGSKQLGAESLVLETSSSFGSTGSLFSMSNSPPIWVVQCKDNGGFNSFNIKTRVPSSASIESDNIVGDVSPSQEPLIQITSEASSFFVKSESPVSDLSISIPAQNTVQILEYPVSQSQQPDGNQLQNKTQLFQGGLHYLPQHPSSPMPFSPYYPVYPMPMQHQPSNQTCPVYLLPVTPTQYHNLPMHCNFIDPNNTSSRPPLYPHTTVITPDIAHKEVFVAQPVAESAKNVLQSIPASTPVVTGNPGPENNFEPITSNSIGCEFDGDSAYNQIYKTQPSPPSLVSQYQTITNHAKEQAASLPV